MRCPPADLTVEMNILTCRHLNLTILDSNCCSERACYYSTRQLFAPLVSGRDRRCIDLQPGSLDPLSG